MPRSRTLAVALGVVAGGLLLGSMLGTAADPKMKNAPERARPAAPDAEPARGWAESAAFEFDAYPDRYPPAFPDEAITDWAPDYPAWTYSDFGSDFGSDLGSDSGEDRAATASREPETGADAPAREPGALPPEPRIPGGLDALY